MYAIRARRSDALKSIYTSLAPHNNTNTNSKMIYINPNVNSRNRRSRSSSIQIDQSKTPLALVDRYDDSSILAYDSEEKNNLPNNLNKMTIDYKFSEDSTKTSGNSIKNNENERSSGVRFNTQQAYQDYQSFGWILKFDVSLDAGFNFLRLSF